MSYSTNTDIENLIEKLPTDLSIKLLSEQKLNQLLEIILDIGRQPQIRYLDESQFISSREVTEEDLEFVINRIGSFGTDNRAGIERSLHRISAIRNRNGKVVGLTIRIGRAVYGTIKIIEDLISTGKSLLLLGRPGVGKTTMLREIARILSDEADRRVIVVDTSNEIAGDGDIPHEGIGKSRRMQVASPSKQHSVMIEAVENHMPEVIVIDEISTELESEASRTIAERGVQLVATAHGNTLDNLLMNPTLSDLIGGIDSVTLGDEEAKRRRTQKTVLERRSPPTFDILIEIQGWNQVNIHADVATSVDKMLRGYPIELDSRILLENGELESKQITLKTTLDSRNGGISDRSTLDAESEPTIWTNKESVKSEHDTDNKNSETGEINKTKILSYGINKGKLFNALKMGNRSAEVVNDINEADLLLTSKTFYRRRTKLLREAEDNGLPVYVLRKNTGPQIHQFLKALDRSQRKKPASDITSTALNEAEEAADKLRQGSRHADLNPQVAYVRRLQHLFAEQNGFKSSSSGKEPDRKVVLYRR